MPRGRPSWPRKRQLPVIETQKRQALAALAEANAALELARLNLGYTQIRSPIDGIVGNRHVRGGRLRDHRRAAHVPWFRPPACIVDANFKGKPDRADAAGTARGDQGRCPAGIEFHGQVESLAPATGAEFSLLPAENATGNFTKIVQRIPIRIRLEGEASTLGRLRPGPLGHCQRGPSDETAMNSAISPPLPESRKLLIFLLMALGQFMALLDIQIVASSVAEISAGLAAAPDESSWIQTAYLMAEIVMIPLSGVLSRAFSTRWLFTASAAGFTLASIGCGFANNIETMIAMRAIQGFVGGAMIPTVFATGFALFPGPKQALIAAILGMSGSLAPTIGPHAWRLDHRDLFVALAFLRQCRPRHDHRLHDSPPGSRR